MASTAMGKIQISRDKIQIANGSLLDFEANTLHQIQVRTTDSTDNGGLTLDRVLTIGFIQGTGIEPV